MKNISALTYRQDIDGLRAIAVLGVLLFHAFPSLLTGGFIGVDVFFVISGYLITASINQDLKHHNFSVWGFYNRRIRRIFPSLLAMLLIVWLMGLALLMPHELQELGISLMSSAYFGNNFLLHAQAGYFDTQADQKPLLHLWSLAVEEQFYIAWPLVLWAIAKNARQGYFLALSLFFCSLLACLALTPTHAASTFFLPYFRAWELIAGALLALFRLEILKIARKLPGNAHWLSICGFALIVFTYSLVSGDQPYPGWRAVFPVLGTFMIILAESDSWFSRHVLSSKPLVAIGLISYPLYLWHWPLFSFARILFGNLSTSLLLGLIGTSFALAWGSYQYLEKPIRFSGWAKKRTVSIPIAALVLLIAIGSLGNFTRIHDGFPARVDNSNWKGLKWADEQIADSNCKSEHGLAGVYCLNSGNGPATIALIGDSHANHFFSGLAKALEKEHESLVLLAGPLTLNDSELLSNLDWLSRKKSIKTVFIAYHSSRIKEKYNPFAGAVERIVTEMLESGKQVVVLVDNPEFSFDPRLCAARPKIATWLGAGGSHMGQCSESRKAVLNNRGEYDTYISHLVARFPEIRLIDMTPPFCDDTVCYALVDDQLLYRDPHHLTITGSAYAFRNMKFDWIKK